VPEQGVRAFVLMYVMWCAAAYMANSITGCDVIVLHHTKHTAKGVQG
jgi:predicted MarR family transcription regulator